MSGTGIDFLPGQLAIPGSGLEDTPKDRPVNVHYSSNRADWCTPEVVLQRVRHVADPIGLDPCWNPDAITAPVEAYTVADDGLALPWQGNGLVFVNPPYSRKHKIDAWIAKAPTADQAIMLLPARTSERWFKPVWKAADGSVYPKYVTPRLALQTLGTEWGRRLTPDIWVEAAIREADARLKPGWGTVIPAPMVVIPDMRFRNEFEAVKRYGGKTLRLYRRDAPPLRYQHPSEKDLWEIPDSEFDFVLHNDWTIDALEIALAQTV